MIWNSEPWKKGLLERAEWLRQRSYRTSWSEASEAKLEQTVMVGFYSIRKLAEANTIADATFCLPMPIERYPAIGKPVTKRNWHRIDELYQLDRGISETRSVKFLCDQMIHSYVFMAYFGAVGRIERVLFASDQRRKTELYSVTISDIVKLFKFVANDYPNEARLTYNPGTQDYDIKSLTHGLRPPFAVSSTKRSKPLSEK
jgi:hypothetical protein